MTAGRANGSLLAAVLGAGVLAAGCGSGGDAASAGATPGERVWADGGCGNCHRLSATSSGGQVGGDLDKLRPTAATVARWVRDGGQGMPAFASQLSEQEIRDVSQFVARVAGR